MPKDPVDNPDNPSEVDETQLLLIEGRFKSLLEASPDPIVIYDNNRRVNYINPVFTQTFGWTLEELRGQVIKFIPEKNWPETEAAIKRMIQGEKVRMLETCRYTKDGQVLDIQLSSALFRDKDGRFAGNVVIYRDVTKLKQAEAALRRARDELEQRVEERTAELVQVNRRLTSEIKDRTNAEEALRENEERYRLLVDNATDAIFIAQDEFIKFPNPKTLEITGYSEEELAQLPFLHLIHPDDRGYLYERINPSLPQDDANATYSFRILNKSGDTVWVQFNSVFINWDSRAAALNTLRDITHNRNVEEQLRQSQKMESIGTLASGIAHDFNNLLMGIQGQTSLMLMASKPSHPHFDNLKAIEEYVNSATDLTKQILSFSKGARYELKPSDLNALVAQQNRMFERTRKEVTIESDFAADLWTVEVDRGQIEQVILNLYVNAWHAMPGSGLLRVKTGNATVSGALGRSINVPSGRYVKLSVADNGCGMDANTRARIFDPFFTTKGDKGGTGLGLATAYNIVQNHQGFINVKSRKGVGTNFMLYFPAVDKKVFVESRGSTTLRKGTEGVLLVDDEEVMIDVGRQMLKGLGYQVMIARNGAEGLKAYEKYGQLIDLVILDMVMPDMDGLQAYDGLIKINPDIKVIFSSGYAMDTKIKAVLARGGNGYIQKPFSVEKLSALIGKVLDGSP